MKIEIKFTGDLFNDAVDFPNMDGKTITVNEATDIYLSTSVDIWPIGNGGKLPGPGGELILKTRGLRAIYSEE